MRANLTAGACHHYGNIDTRMLAIKWKSFPHVTPLQTISEIILLIFLELFKASC